MMRASSMCLICIELDKKKLTPWEAARNRREMLDILDEAHLDELDIKIREALAQWIEENKDTDN